MKLAVVVQRYGADINGGAEQHARYIAERMAKYAQVEVVTTCARDYVTWKNELPAGVETVNGIPVRRFPVARERQPLDFGRRSRQVFDETHSLADELAWLDSEGPTSPRARRLPDERGSGLRLRPALQLPLLPLVAHRAAARLALHSRPDR